MSHNNRQKLRIAIRRYNYVHQKVDQRVKDGAKKEDLGWYLSELEALRWLINLGFEQTARMTGVDQTKLMREYEY